MIDPVCLIHGKQMSEHKCLSCCLCFKPMEPSECSWTPDGKREDVCVECAIKERDVLLHLYAQVRDELDSARGMIEALKSQVKTLEGARDYWGKHYFELRSKEQSQGLL